jgi:hypothetical protein
MVEYYIASISTTNFVEMNPFEIEFKFSCDNKKDSNIKHIFHNCVAYNLVY